MSTLLLRLAAPMQSWGSGSKFDRRLTENEPTKSGIIGLLSCAMGIRREDSLAIFDDVRFGVRRDQEGELGIDFQMVHEQKSTKNPGSWVTYRYYLFDAAFLAGIEGERGLLEKMEQAVLSPAFPIYLGRRSCPPVGPVSLGIRELSLEASLREEPWIASDWYKKRMEAKLKYGAKPMSLEIIRDAAVTEPPAYSVRDMPVTFNPERRLYRFRNVVREQVSLAKVWPNLCETLTSDKATEHDPMALLEENDVSIKD